MSTDSTGTLYVVGTPIGNLDDLSPRARRILDEVDLIAAEDTRRTRGLLSSIQVSNRLIAYHEHNETQQTPVLIGRLQAGESVALVSDAGTPLVSDPGWVLVGAARDAGIPVITVPGASAVVAALAVAGLPTDRVAFEGFLPRRSSARQARLAALAGEPRTMVFYESVHRVPETLAALEAQFGPDRAAVVARELTKIHESTVGGSLAELRRKLDGEIPLKGEFVILLAGAESDYSAADEEIIRVFTALVKEVSPKTAVALTAEITGVARNRVYALTRTD